MNYNSKIFFTILTFVVFVNIDSVQVLQLMALGIDCRKFDFIDCPDSQSIELALNQLVALGAVINGKQTELTELGRKMAKFPLDPKYSKVLLMAPQFGCLEEVNNSIKSNSIEILYYEKHCEIAGSQYCCSVIRRRCIHK